MLIKSKTFKRSLSVYQLITNCKKGSMVYSEALVSFKDMDNNRRGMIRRELKKIYQLSCRQYQKSNISLVHEPAKEEYFCIIFGTNKNIKAYDVLSFFQKELFYYSDRFNNARARKLIYLWEYFETLQKSEKSLNSGDIHAYSC